MGHCPTVLAMVEEYLRQNGYDGLFEGDSECACRLSCLGHACGDVPAGCRAGHFLLIPKDADLNCDFCIGNKDMPDRPIPNVNGGERDE